jgi:flagellar motor switch protein FliG
MMQTRGRLTGRQKAAVFLVTVGPELSAKIIRCLSEEQIEQLTLEIAAARKIEPELRDSVMMEFQNMCRARDYITQGGIDYAKDVLERALGNQRAVDIIRRLTSSLQVRPFQFIRGTNPSEVLQFIQGEHPQTIALILAYLDPGQAGAIMMALEPELKFDVARRLALMERTSPDLVREIEKILERKFSTLVQQEYAPVGGVQCIVDILNRVDRSTEKSIMENLEMEAPELAGEIKKRMFLFEDIVILDDRAVQRVLREVDLSKDLPLALKNVPENVKAKVFRNMSSRAVETLTEDMRYMGPVRLKDIEEAQQRIVNIIRKLDEEGEIVISRGGEAEIVV